MTTARFTNKPNRMSAQMQEQQRNRYRHKLQTMLQNGERMTEGQLFDAREFGLTQ